MPAVALRNLRLALGHREARADCVGGELINRVAADSPVGKLVFIKAVGHMRMPFATYRLDNKAGLEPGRNRRASCNGSGGRPRRWIR